jgi:GntR family transcriptional repressor for pyruvate dehydrogenase complex
MYTTIQTARLYQQVVAQIEQRVLTGDLKVGDQLPSERELGQQFGVSRTAIREAVKTLHQKGLVDVQVGRGTFITNGASRLMRHSLDLMLKIGHSEGSAHLVEIREILEPEIAALAASRAKAEHLKALREAVATMDAALNDADAFIEADLDFHLALAEATQNPLMLTLLDSIVDVLREQRANIFKVAGGPKRGQTHHKNILATIERHDAEAAREAMRAHMRQVRRDSKASSMSVR